MNRTSMHDPAVLSVVETGASSRLHLVRDHPAGQALCGTDARVSTVVRRTETACCAPCLRHALEGGHVVAVTASNSFVNLRRLAVAGDAPEEDAL